MKAKLIVVGGDAKAAEIKLRLPTVIGRGREASLTLPHPLVSRQHCEIYEDSGKLCVRDLGSLNGTFVNNHKIEQATVLPSGDLLTIGTVTFRAVYSESEDAVQPASDQTVDTSHAATEFVPPPAPIADTHAAKGDDGFIDESDEVEPVANDEATTPAPVAAPVATPVAVATPADNAGGLEENARHQENDADSGAAEEPVGLDADDDEDFDFLDSEVDTVEADEPVATDPPIRETVDFPPAGADGQNLSPTTPPDQSDDEDDSLNAFFEGLR